MTSTISILQHNLDITEVGDVQVSEIVEDETVGGYVRTISIYNDPPEGTAAATLMVQVKIRSTTETNLHITVPEQEF